MRRLVGCCAAVLVLLTACDDRGPERTSDPLSPMGAYAPGDKNPGVNLDQWANEVGSETWQNGNLNGNNSEYAELRVVPFRLAVEKLVPGTTHTIHINHDFTAGGRKAYDYLASYDATETGVDLCGTGGGGVSSLCAEPGGLPTPDAEVFPRDPFVGFSGTGGQRLVGGGPTGPNSGLTDSPGGIPTSVALNGLTDVQRQLRIYGGTIDNITVPQHDGPLTANSTADMVVEFTVDPSNPTGGVLLAWGGHLACSYCWDNLLGGDFNGASQINGAPWHMRTQNLDGGGASNQDRSIQPSAIQPPAIIDGYKYEDLNKNGTHDSGEPFLAGWTIELWLDGSKFTETVTDGSGYFMFDVLPPDLTFEVKEMCPSGGPWIQSEPTPTNGCGSGVHTILTEGGTTHTVYFGNYRTADKSGVKFHDLNADGVKDSGEPGLDGWTIYVDYNDNGVLDTGEPSAVTASDGTYLISGINVGTFKVREVGQQDWFCSYPAANDAFGCYYLEDFSGPGPFVDNHFGNWTYATKSGTKFHDLDADGVKDSGELGLENWTIYVDYNGNGTKESTEPGAPTAADGSYTIQGINPGTWRVREVGQTDWFCSLPTNVDAYGCYYEETFVSDADEVGNDFGNWTWATKSGMKFEDLDGDGVKDPGEPGLPDWTIHLLQGGSMVASAVTASDGSYGFPNVTPGIDYLVCEVVPASTPAWAQTLPVAGTGIGACPAGASYGPYGYMINLNSDEDDTGNDFGNFKAATKSGTKFHDLNADGVWQTATEPGLENWVIYVDYDDDGVKDSNEPSASTAADGTYQINGILAGTYKVREVGQTDWFCSYPADDDGKGCYYSETFGSSSAETDNNFGNWTWASKSGTKFEDVNKNGVKDAGESGLGGWTIYVDFDGDGYTSGVDSAAVTAGDGTYTINGIKPGTYDVHEVAQTDWTCSYPTTSDAQGCGHLGEVFTSGQNNPGNDFGNWTTASKSGTKFHDLDADGVKEAGEPGLENWVIYVDYDDDGVLDAGEPSASTAADGTYTIQGIDPGTWKVREVGQADWFCSFPTDDDGKGCYHSDTFGSGDAILENDFGNWTWASKSGTKFEDLNANGAWDSGEPGLPGWTIYVDQDGDGYDATEPQAITAADGTYTINGIQPGVGYRIYEVQQAGWTCSFPADTDANGCYYDELFVSGQPEIDNDFGNYEPAEIDGYKYEDVNRNGSYDDTVDGFLENWAIQLWQGGGVIASTTTDASGYFAFTGLMPGLTYEVREVCPTTVPGETWTQTEPTPTNGCGSGVHGGIIPESGETITRYFGNYQTFTLNGLATKFHDLNADGVWDSPGEPGLAGITIYIDYNNNQSLDAATEPSVVTAADGTFSFEGTELLDGTYYVREIASGWTCSYPNAGAGDADALTGAVTSSQCYHQITIPGALTGAENFGNWKPATKSGFKYYDVGNDGDGDGLPDAGDSGLSGFVIRLYYDADGSGSWDAGDTFIDDETTAGDGSYSFPGLDPGDYLVCEETKSGFILSYPGGTTCMSLSGAELGGHAFDLVSDELEENNNFFNTAEIYGCTPGYWKNHTDRWIDYSPITTLGSVFDPGTLYPTAMAPYAGTTLIEALEFPGGSGVEGAKRILFRAAVSSVLNFTAINDPMQPFVFVVPAYGGLGEITTLAGLQSAVINALQSGDRGTILALATQLDEANNAVNNCPLSGTRAFKGT